MFIKVFIIFAVLNPCFTRSLRNNVNDNGPQHLMNRQNRQISFEYFTDYEEINTFQNSKVNGGHESSFSNAGANSNSFNPRGSSSSAANAFAHDNYFGPNHFGSSSGNAQAQSLGTDGAFGGIGASAANTNSHSFNLGPNGINANSAFSGSQTYKLFNGKTLNVAYANGFSLGQDGRPSISNSNSVTID